MARSFREQSGKRTVRNRPGQGIQALRVGGRTHGVTFAGRHVLAPIDRYGPQLPHDPAENRPPKKTMPCSKDDPSRKVGQDECAIDNGIGVPGNNAAAAGGGYVLEPGRLDPAKE